MPPALRFQTVLDGVFNQRGQHHWRERDGQQIVRHIDTKFEKTIGIESFYVAISRARHEARLYVDDRSKLTIAVGRSQQKQYGLEALESNPAVAMSTNVRETNLGRVTDRGQ